MNSDGKVWCALFAAVSTVLCVCFGVGALHVLSVKRAAIEAGYSQQTLQGVHGVYWVKDGKKLEDINER